jgi:hypothetical protein
LRPSTTKLSEIKASHADGPVPGATALQPELDERPDRCPPGPAGASGVG